MQIFRIVCVCHTKIRHAEAVNTAPTWSLFLYMYVSVPASICTTQTFNVWRYMLNMHKVNSEISVENDILIWNVKLFANRNGF